MNIVEIYFFRDFPMIIEEKHRFFVGYKERGQMVLGLILGWPAGCEIAGRTTLAMQKWEPSNPSGSESFPIGTDSIFGQSHLRRGHSSKNWDVRKPTTRNKDDGIPPKNTRNLVRC